MPSILTTLLSLAALTRGSPLCEDYQQCMQETFNHEKGPINCNGHESCKEGTILSNNEVTCSGRESCDHTAITTSSMLKCSGYKACQYGDHEASGRVTCDSYYSCYEANIIKHFTGENIADLVHCNSQSSCRAAIITGYGNGVRCNGQESCWNAHINVMDAEPSYTDIICNGESSCFWTTITGSSLECNGWRSCETAKITASYILADSYNAIAKTKIYGKMNEELRIDVTGYKAANRAEINSAESLLVHVNLYGFKAGNKGKLICLDSAICTVNCESNACQGFTMQCHLGSTCNISPPECEQSENMGTAVNGVYCPSVIGSANEYVAPVNDDIVDDGVYNNDPLEFTQYVALDQYAHGICYNNDECLGEAMDLNSEIACFGPNACKAAQIQTNGNLRCDGDEACRGSAIISSQSDTSCGGPLSCEDVHTINSGKNLHCFGESSCSNVGQIKGESQSKLYFDGKLSGHHSVFSQHNDKEQTKSESFLYCGSEEACSDSHFEADIYGQVRCNSYRACSGTTLKPNGVAPTGGSVMCNSKESCVDAVIDGAQYGTEGQQTTTLWCYGTDCAKDATIKEVTNIHIYGTIPGAFIDCGTLQTNTPISVTMYGHNSGAGATIKARLNTKITLNCNGNGCADLTFDCFDSFGKSGKVCKIKPRQCMERANNGLYLDDVGIHCPTYIPSKNQRSDRDYYFVNNGLVETTTMPSQQYYVIALLLSFALFLSFICYRSYLNLSSNNAAKKVENEYSTLLA